VSGAALDNAEAGPEFCPERQETFLAYYPRWLKINVTVLLVALCVLGPKYLHPHAAPTTAIPTSAPAVPRLTLTEHPTATTTSPTLALEDNTPVDPATAAAMHENETDDHDQRMLKAPDPALTEDTAEGPLPRIGADGRMPWQAYARPFNAADRRPRIALVIADLGLSNVTTLATVDRRPANVTLAFDSQSPIVGSWLARARQLGHETLLSLSMESFDYPRSDPGPKTLLTTLPDGYNLNRLASALHQGTGYIGVTTLTGSRFTSDPNKLPPILAYLQNRGLLFFDSHVSPHSLVGDYARQNRMAVAQNAVRIDETASPETIDAALTNLEKTARLTGRAVGLVSPLPMTLDKLEAWIGQLASHGLVLAPLSAVTE
jgi:polysaccharide deacetylase 2 family uncharacterized protein YibQ